MDDPLEALITDAADADSDHWYEPALRHLRGRELFLHLTDVDPAGGQPSMSAAPDGIVVYTTRRRPGITYGGILWENLVDMVAKNPQMPGVRIVNDADDWIALGRDVLEPEPPAAGGGPRFTLDGIDWDQSGGGLPHAIPELQQQLPLSAQAFRQMAGPDRGDYFVAVLQRPLVYHPRPDFDWGRTQPEFVGRDEGGPYLSVHAVVICSLFTGTQLHAGMKSFPVRVALVVDNTLGRDDTLAFHKCDYAGQGFVSDLAPSPTNPTAR